MPKGHSQVKDETVQIVFDGGDPIRATSYSVVGSVRGTIGSGFLVGGSKPEVSSDDMIAQANSMMWDPENDMWDPSADVILTITDRNGASALISFNDSVAGNNQIYSRTAILSEINLRLAQEGVTAAASFVDTNNNGVADQLIITGNYSGSGEKVIITGSGVEQLGLVAGVTIGTAATSDFSSGGLEFTLTEGNNPWLPNESMIFETTAEVL